MTYDFKRKDLNIDQLNRYMLTKTLSMFEWANLPNTIPSKEIERLLQISGYAFVTKADDGNLYAFNGGLGGLPDVYGNHTEIIINNPALKFNKTCNLKTDGVLISNDDLKIGLIPLFTKHNFMLVENDINMLLHGYSTRMQTLISASDDKTKDSAENYIKKVVDGEISIIAENALFDGVKIQSVHSSQGSSVTQLTEYHQYIKASMLNEIGLSANFNMKRERLTSSEVEQGDDSLFPFVYNMMQNRIVAVKEINEMFETSIDVDFGSVWNLKNRKLVDGIINPVNEPSNEPPNEPLTDPATITPSEVLTDEPLPVATNSNNDSASDIEQTQAKTIDELMELLDDENLTNDDIQAIDDLITEIEDKKDD
jgi:hypothetical protein